TWIVEAEARPIIRFEQEMVVLLNLRMIDPPAPGHAQVEDHRVVPTGMDQSVFRAPPETGDPRTGEPLAKVLRERPSQVCPASFKPRDPPALEDMSQSANGGLDFGKLRHRPDMAKAPQPR